MPFAGGEQEESSGVEITVRGSTIEAALRRDNPGAPPEEIKGISALVALVASALVAVGLSGPSLAATLATLLAKRNALRGPSIAGDEDRDLASVVAREPDLMEKLVDANLAGLQELLRAAQSGEVLTGTGIGAPMTPAAADARLASIASQVDIESWAGSVARPGDLAKRLGVARSTVDTWRQQGLVVALPRGRRAHVYPLEQFSDRRPLEGIPEVLLAAHDNHSVAWRWLRTPHVDFDGETPLTALQHGDAIVVAAAADRSLA